MTCYEQVHIYIYMMLFSFLPAGLINPVICWWGPILGDLTFTSGDRDCAVLFGKCGSAKREIQGRGAGVALGSIKANEVVFSRC